MLFPSTFNLYQLPSLPFGTLSRCILADRDAEAFSSYFSKMPWLAIGYDNKELKTMCDGTLWPHIDAAYSTGSFRYNELLDVEGIPTLALFGPDGTLITEEGAHDPHRLPDVSHL